MQGADMPVTPPICKTCGKAEWRHRCSGPAPIAVVEPVTPPKAKRKKRRRDRRAYNRKYWRDKRSPKVKKAKQNNDHAGDLGGQSEGIARPTS
jgi:hypothetical protein